MAVRIVVVLLVEVRAGTHVEQMLQRATAPRRAVQSRDVVRHGRVEVDHTLSDEHAGECRCQRLRHRHQEVRVGGTHDAAVLLER
jgi:hypothetical protein